MKTSNSINDDNIYKPSKVLVECVARNIESMNTINIFTNTVEKTAYENIESLIYRSVTGFLATIAQGLAYGDGQYAVLGENGQLSSNVLEGFLVRLPIKNNIETFNKTLYENLVQAANHNQINNEFGKLVRHQDKLIIERIKVIEKKDTNKIKRAVINRIG